MSSTNKTTNLELSQFIGSDSPKWLTDYNADMQKIDTAVGAVQSQANATDLVVSGHSTAIESLQATEGEHGTAIADLRTDVNHNAGDINTINSLIGNGEPTTTDKTIIGAINELHADTLEKLDADQVTGTQVKVGQYVITYTADGVETYAGAIKKLYDLYAAAIAAGSSDERFELVNVAIDNSNMPNFQYQSDIIGGQSAYDIYASCILNEAAAFSIISAHISGVESDNRYGGLYFDKTTYAISSADLSANVPANTTILTIRYNKYRVIAG